MKDVEQKSVSKQIIQTIQKLDCYSLPAYGTRKITPLPINMERKGGVQFEVNGYQHQGKVFIELTAKDSYTITLGKIVEVEGTPTFIQHHRFTDIPTEKLTQILDERIEGIP